MTHEQTAKRVAAELLAADGCLDAYVRHIESILASNEPRKRLVQDFTRLVKELAEKRDHLIVAIENAESDCKSLVARLGQREDELRQAEAKLASAQQERAITRQLPSRDEIHRHLQDKAARLLDMDREAGAILKRLVEGPILAVPYQQFGSNKVVLRAEFKLRDELFGLLQRMAVPLDELPGELRPVVVDLFPPSDVPANAVKAYALKEANLSWQESCQCQRNRQSRTNNA